MTRGLKTLILHQSIRRSGGASIGYILDDFLRQKYGANTYERVDARASHPKRQAAVNRFNKKETGQFAFLLENRACSSTIKLLAVDIVVLYDSDWNPANDIRALQKISFDSKAEQMKVFRLYSSCTVEERALVLAKKNLKLDNNLQAFGRTTSDSLVMWGASYLFNQLDDYHAYTNNAAFIVASGHSVLDEVTQEFQAILSESCKNIGLSVISEVRSSAENYSMNIPLLGEAKKQLKDGEEPYIFWKNLLDRKDPPWRHIRASHSRNRKRVQYMNESPDAENDNVAKRHKRGPSSVQFELGEYQVTQPACSDGGGSSILFASDKSKTCWTESVTSDSYPNRKYGQSSHGPEVDVGEPEGKGVLFDEQKDLYSFLEGETIKLCQILQLWEVVMDMVRRFLKYVIENHQVSTDSPAYVQALQVSLVPGKQIPRNLVFAELQRENQSSSHVEFSASQVVHAVNNSLLSNHGAPETESREQLHSTSVDVILTGNQFPTFEVEHRNHSRAGSSFPTAEVGEDEVLVREPSSESPESSQLRGNHLDPCPVARVPELPIPTADAGEDEVLVHEPSSESQENSQLRGTHLDPCPVARVQELPNHAPRDLHGHSPQVTTGNSTPELPDEPLQIELERMQKESERFDFTAQFLM
ncbi:helicase protein MOM1-like isoform X1 [Henckelia pumila]|uniref:helicase protein MOM1-like isoform X1 n=1 Tax=Henckelia pumila TaxID=405737 RepID=UPI003C6E346D